MRAVFYAKDGTEFEDRWDCEAYEDFIDHPGLMRIVFQDSAFNDCSFKAYKDIYDDYTYQNADIVIVHNEEEVSDLQWLASSGGWCEWEQITSPGTWKRTVVEETLEGKWEVQND